LERAIPSKQLVQFESLGKFMQDVWLLSFVLVFIRNDATIPAPFLWVCILFVIGIGVTYLFRKTGYQIAVSVMITVSISMVGFFIGAPFWFIVFMIAFAIWRIHERFAKVQEDATHDGIYFTLMVVVFAFAYFLATVLNNAGAIQNTLILAVIGIMLFILDRMIVQWLRSKSSNRLSFTKVLGVYAAIIGLASIVLGLITGIGNKARETFVSLFGDVLMVIFYPIGRLIDWLKGVITSDVQPLEARESQPQGEMEFEEREIGITELQNVSMDLPWMAIICVIGILAIVVIVWRLTKHKIEPIEIVKEIVQYERSQMEHSTHHAGHSAEWHYSMETNLVRDAYREFEKQAGKKGIHRTQNETVREWFKRESWSVSERFYDVYDVVRYSGVLMNEQDGNWFIDELNKLSEKNFQSEV